MNREERKQAIKDAKQTVAEGLRQIREAEASYAELEKAAKAEVEAKLAGVRGVVEELKDALSPAAAALVELAPAGKAFDFGDLGTFKFRRYPKNHAKAGLTYPLSADVEVI